MTERNFPFEEMKLIFTRKDKWVEWDNPYPDIDQDLMNEESIIMATKIITSDLYNVAHAEVAFPISFFSYDALADFTFTHHVYEYYNKILNNLAFELKNLEKSANYAIISPIIVRPESKNLVKLLDNLLTLDDFGLNHHAEYDFFEFLVDIIRGLEPLTTPNDCIQYDQYDYDFIRKLIFESIPTFHDSYMFPYDSAAAFMLGHLNKVGTENFIYDLKTIECLTSAGAACVNFSEACDGQNIDIEWGSILLVTSNGCYTFDSNKTSIVSIDNTYRPLYKLFVS